MTTWELLGVIPGSRLPGALCPSAAWAAMQRVQTARFRRKPRGISTGCRWPWQAGRQADGQAGMAGWLTDWLQAAGWQTDWLQAAGWQTDWLQATGWQTDWLQVLLGQLLWSVVLVVFAVARGLAGGSLAVAVVADAVGSGEGADAAEEVAGCLEKVRHTCGGRTTSISSCLTDWQLEAAAQHNRLSRGVACLHGASL